MENSQWLNTCEAIEKSFRQDASYLIEEPHFIMVVWKSRLEYFPWPLNVNPDVRGCKCCVVIKAQATFIDRKFGIFCITHSYITGSWLPDNCFWNAHMVHGHCVYAKIFYESLWWHNYMDVFPALRVLCWGYSPVTGEFPQNGRASNADFDAYLMRVRPSR